MTAQQRRLTHAAATCGLATGLVVGMAPPSWPIAASLALIPGFALVWLWNRPTTFVADAAIRDALASGVALAARPAPGKRRDRRSADAAALQTRAEPIQRDNKRTFTP